MDSALWGRVVLAMLASCLLGGCAAPLKLTESEWRAGPEAFGQRELIIETSLDNVVATPAAFGRHSVQLSGHPEYVGHRIDHPYWYFYLTDESGSRLLCYEQNYRLTHRSVVERLLRRAQSLGEPVTVGGRLKRGGELELDWIDYGAWHLDTDYHPPSLLISP